VGECLKITNTLVVMVFIVLAGFSFVHGRQEFDQGVYSELISSAEIDGHRALRASGGFFASKIKAQRASSAGAVDDYNAFEAEARLYKLAETEAKNRSAEFLKKAKAFLLGNNVEKESDFLCKIFGVVNGKYGLGLRIAAHGVLAAMCAYGSYSIFKRIFRSDSIKNEND